MFKKRLTMQISTNVRRIALFFLSMVLSSSIIFAQEKTITGKVTAEGEGPLPGVNVTVQGTVIGAITDLNGAYYNQSARSDICTCFFIYRLSDQTDGCRQPDNDRHGSSFRC